MKSQRFIGPWPKSIVKSQSVKLLRHESEDIGIVRMASNQMRWAAVFSTVWSGEKQNLGRLRSSELQQSMHEQTKPWTIDVKMEKETKPSDRRMPLVIVTDPSKMRNMLRKWKSTVKSHTRVADTDWEVKIRKPLSKEIKVKFKQLMASAKPYQLSLRRA